MKGKRNYLRWVSRASSLICLGAIGLTGIFWRRIPERVPTHYNAAGAADAWGDRSSIIVVLVFMVFMLGVMKISEYYLRSGGESENVSESEREEFSRSYPMLVWIDFLIQGMFAYIHFCSASARDLGRGFLPITVISIVIPIVYYLVVRQSEECGDSPRGKNGINGENGANGENGVNSKNSVNGENGEEGEKGGDARVSRKEQRSIYKMQEAQERGETYRTKIDWWLGLILGGTMLMPFVICGQIFVREGQVEWGTLITGIAMIALCGPMFFIRYTLYSAHVKVDSIIWGKVRIAYKDITAVKPTHSPLSSAAMSLDRVQIDYVRNGRHDMVLVSPVRKKEFIRKLKIYAGLS